MLYASGQAVIAGGIIVDREPRAARCDHLEEAGVQRLGLLAPNAQHHLDASRAEQYAGESGGWGRPDGKVTALYARLLNPLVIEHDDKQDPVITGLVATGVPRARSWRSASGYDGRPFR